jgi:hypothetical protein
VLPSIDGRRDRSKDGGARRYHLDLAVLRLLPLADDGFAGQSASDEPAPSALLGTWQRETRCQELVSALTDAGLDRWVLEFVAGNGFVPGVTSPDQIADPANPCDGTSACRSKISTWSVGSGPETR